MNSLQRFSPIFASASMFAVGACSYSSDVPSVSTVGQSQAAIKGGLASSYTYVQIGPVGGAPDTGSVANGVNNQNQVAGTTGAIDGTGHAFLWDNSQEYDLGVAATGKSADEFWSSGWALNNLGTVAGDSDVNNTSPPQGALFAVDAGARSIGNGYGVKGYASVFGINDQGLAVGVRSASQSAVNNAFLYVDGGFEDLGTLGATTKTEYGENGTAYAINNSGVIVGEALAKAKPDNQLHAFVYQDGGMRDLGGFAAEEYSTARGLNASGDIVGWATLADGGLRGAIWPDGGAVISLGVLDGGSESYAQAINSSGIAVGGSKLANSPETNAGHAVAWILNAEGSPEAIIDLNSLRGVPADIELQTALGINDNGWIVGETCNVDCDPGKQSTGEGFILIPNP